VSGQLQDLAALLPVPCWMEGWVGPRAGVLSMGSKPQFVDRPAPSLNTVPRGLFRRHFLDKAHVKVRYVVCYMYLLRSVCV